TTTAASGGWSTTLPSEPALADGTYTFSASVSDTNGNAATPPATQPVTVAETLPTITMAAIDGNDVINASQAAAGVTISGTETGADGSTVTVTILDASNTVVETLTTTAASGGWSTTLPSEPALADGTYTFSASVSDTNGNAATPPATQPVTVAETLPTITMAAIDGND